MAVQVLVGANAATLAQQFLTQVTSFTQAATQLQSSGGQLANTSEWQGQSATQFDTDFRQFVQQVKLMEQSLTKMAQGAKTVITNIDTTDQSGAAQIGTFTG
jgi:uncharacterized protein YukE